MNTIRKVGFCLILGAFLVLSPVAKAEGDSGRYFIKSTKGFWKNTLGVRHNFDDGFTTDATDFQLRLARVFGVDIEAVPVLQILPNELATNSQPSPTPVISPNPTPVLKSIKGKGGVLRYLPSDQTPWGVETMYNDSNINSTNGGVNVNVAVLDTGVLTSHPDLSRRISQCKDFTNPKAPMVDGKCEDKNGHGTHVSGIIAADSGSDGKGIYGVAPQAKIFAYKVCGANGSCYADDIASGIYDAVKQGANIINMSFGSDQESSLIRDAVSYASSQGVLLVAASGNDGPFQDSIDYPAAYSSVIAVGAVNQSRNVTDWSSRGANSLTNPSTIDDHDLEFVAPGDYIESTWNNNAYYILSGTSMASPFVAGLAAKYWQSSAIDKAGATRDLLHSLASTEGLSPVGDVDAFGLGLPQVQ